MGDQPFQVELSLLHQLRDRHQITRRPLGRNADARLPHKGWRVGKAQVFLVKAGQHHLAASAGLQTPDQGVEQAGVAADVVDATVVFAAVFIGVDHRVAVGALAPRRLRFPDRGGWQIQRQIQARQQAPHHPVANDQVGHTQRQIMPPARHGVVRSSRQRQQHAACADAGGQAHRAAVRQDQPLGRAAEDIGGLFEAVGARNKHGLANGQLGVRTPAHHRAHGLVAWHQRIGQAGKGRHGAVPQQALGAGADAAVVHLHFHVGGPHIGELQALHRQHLGADEDDGAGVLRGDGLHGTGLSLRLTGMPKLASRTAQRHIFRLNPDFREKPP